MDSNVNRHSIISYDVTSTRSFYNLVPRVLSLARENRERTLETRVRLLQELCIRSLGLNAKICKKVFTNIRRNSLKIDNNRARLRVVGFCS